MDSPWPKTAENGYAATASGGVPCEISEFVYLSVLPTNYPPDFSVSGEIWSMRVPITDIALGGRVVEGCPGDLSAFVNLTRHLSKPKRRKNSERLQGVGVSVGGTIAHVSCVVESPEEMFIAKQYQRLVAKEVHLQRTVYGWAQLALRAVAVEGVPRACPRRACLQGFACARLIARFGRW